MSPFTQSSRCIRRLVLLSGLLINHTLVHAQPDSLEYGRLPHESIVIGGKDNFALFDKAFYTNQLFLLGESHGIQKPQEIDFELLKHLNQKTGLHYYLAELDATKARYVNTYLKTGQEALLNQVFSELDTGAGPVGESRLSRQDP